MSLICFLFWPKSSDNMLVICPWCLPQFHLPTSGPPSADTPGWTHPRCPLTPPLNAYCSVNGLMRIFHLSFWFFSPAQHFEPFLGLFAHPIYEALSCVESCSLPTLDFVVQFCIPLTHSRTLQPLNPDLADCWPPDLADSGDPWLHVLMC